ncbi:MAG: MATE family efflux transporter [Bacteroidales bacterium]|nr:MATE family efflux transporter [Bacteroidales bacterium]
MSPLNKEILHIALPSILANITVPVVGMVDMAVAGHLHGDAGAAAFIGAVSIGSMLFDLLYWNFYFLRAGSSGLAAQAFGRGDRRECSRILVRGVGVALAFSLLILALQVPFLKLAFLVVDCSPEVAELAFRYFYIRVWAAPATVSLMALRGWFIGMQDSLSSMWTDLTVNVVNVLASIVLSVGIGSFDGFGFAGIAYGTVVAQYCGLAYAFFRVLSRYGDLVSADGRFDVSLIGESFRREDLRSFFTLNRDLFLRSLGITAIYIGFTVISARFGDLMLASSAIIMKILMLFSFFTDGFAYAGEALCGKYIGQGSVEMTRRSVRGVFIWSMGIAAVFILIYVTAGIPLVKLMTTDGAVVEACRAFIPWLVLMPPLGCAAFTWDGIYEGATASRPIRDAMLWAMVAFFGVWTAGKFVLDHFFPCAENYGYQAIHTLLAAYFMHLLVRTVYLSVTYRRCILVVPFVNHL